VGRFPRFAHLLSFGGTHLIRQLCFISMLTEADHLGGAGCRGGIGVVGLVLVVAALVAVLRATVGRAWSLLRRPLCRRQLFGAEDLRLTFNLLTLQRVV
jgi:hypothetical protein